MFAVSIWAALLLLIALLINGFISLAQNVQIAKKIGIRYVIVPWYNYNRLNSLIYFRLLVRPLNKVLWEPSILSWRRLVVGTWPWRVRYSPFAKLGTDTFLTVSPGGLILNTADADVITQITTRNTDFLKPIHLYRSVDIYGKNVVSTEGSAWRHHRKLTSPAFTEKNNQLVWKETLDRTQTMLAAWLGPDGSSKTIHQVAGDTMRLSINVISRAGLGHEMEWSREPEDGHISQNKSLPAGHRMTFSYALIYILSHLYYLIFIPRWFLKAAPFATLRTSLAAYDEWGMYMREMVAAKKDAVRSGASETSTIDLIGQLVKGQEDERKPDGPAALADSEVLGNLFVFIIAGHETSANSIHFSLLLLALHPEVQKEVQKDLTNIMKDRPVSEWEYEHDLPRLLNSMLGAVLSEELRLIAPVITIPKIVCSTPQQLMVDGKEIILPAKTMIRLCVPGVHRNPRFWPSGPPKNPQKPYFPHGNVDNDLEEFKPERWIKKGTKSGGADIQTPNSLYTPPKGAYIPFSDGQRACLGRRFAQVEVLAALAVILSKYTVELAVEEWASDDEVEKMSEDEKRETWKKAEDKANWTWQMKMNQVITLQIRGAHVPMRFVRRGEERFAHLSDG